MQPTALEDLRVIFDPLVTNSGTQNEKMMKNIIEICLPILARTGRDYENMRF